MQPKSPLSLFCLSSFLAFSSISFLLFANLTASDPQSQFLDIGCSLYNVTSRAAFFNNINATFAEIRSKLNSTARFATADRARASNPLYVLFQCRGYLSTSDCLACFTVAAVHIRNCSAANGARISYDGCFLRYESNNFYGETTALGNFGRCGNGTASKVVGFNQTADKLLRDLTVATPRINGYFGAARREGAGGAVVYGVAQCVETASETGCGDCLRVAYGNIQRCPPDGNGRGVDAGCFLRYSDKEFFSLNQTVDIERFLTGKSSKRKKAIIGGAVGGAAAILLFLVLLLLLRHSKKTKKKPQKGDILGATELRGPVNFRYKDLKIATKNFSQENKLGGGGFGDVYKGVLRNGKIVAVKKLVLSQSTTAKEDFESEAKLISNVHHRNVIRLLGCCSRGTELLLVYEFMANSSLDKLLFGERRGTLSWKQRFDIIIGMARGIAYLHDEFHSRIIHRDIKSSNILLDDDLQPKIADFGLARLLPEDKSHLSTRFAGTLGYTAPEYAIHGQLTEKVDTYSYGVVVLEIVSGEKSNEPMREPEKQYLLEWAKNSMLVRVLEWRDMCKNNWIRKKKKGQIDFLYHLLSFTIFCILKMQIFSSRISMIQAMTGNLYPKNCLQP
ncbi:cysteine-rich receptor-like protein kinase 2 isoform X3 [Magnolia sinica]|uniref:cysteine-rich receptor-like protein kinase 2 isoform X3 n=1 Tax=Magnolia sinica TaxID=86752 RepID=UPI00265ABB18|nr:cysteine-rich receptor-like protein kinase 2 isoform X3 [Magnolia sinica]